MKRVFAHIGFSSAITLIVINLVAVEYVSHITAGLAVIFAASLAVKKYRQALTVPICFGSALFACLLFLCVYYSAVAPALELNGSTAQISFYITSLPEFDSGKYIYTARSTHILLNGAPQTLKLRIISSEPLNVNAYTIINANAKLKATGGSAFSSFGYWGNGIYLSAELKGFSADSVTVFSPMKYILLLRNDIIETFMRSINNDMGALSAALVTGDRYYISDEITKSFRLAGASHLIAVSGLHLSVITGAIYFVFKRLGAGRVLTSSAIIIVTLLYVALAAFTPSIVRAGIMVILVFCAELIGRKADALNSLGLAVFIMCLNPFAVSSAGAVLSVLSVFSLIKATPYVKGKLGVLYEHIAKMKAPFFKPLRKLLYFIADSVIVSVSITVITLPAMYYFFDYTSASSVVSNLILLPLGSLATIMSFIGYICCKLNVFTSLVLYSCAKMNLIIINSVRLFSTFYTLTVNLPAEFAFIISGALLVAAAAVITRGINKKND